LYVSRILRLALAIEIMILLGSAVAISGDFQDSWILEGLEVPFAVFVVTYVSYFTVEKRLNWLILFAVIAHATFLLIPNLKYVWFQGVAIDQHRQYRLALDTYNKGYLEQGNIYSETPLLALSFAVYSVISGLPILQSMKYFPLILWFTYPIWIYVLLRQLKANFSLLKYALLVSSIPVKPEISYVVSGSLFGVFFVLLILIQFVKLGEDRKRHNWILAIIFTLALVAGHLFSSMILSTTLLVVTLLLFLFGRFSHGFILAKPSLRSTLTVVVMSISWFSLIAQQLAKLTIDFFLYYSNKLLNTSFVTRPIMHEASIPSRFFKIGFISQLKIALVFNGGDFLLALFTIVAVLITIKEVWLRKKRAVLFLSFYVITLMIILLFGLVFNLGFNWDDRIFRLLSIVAPIFSGIFLYYIETKLHRRAVPMIIVGLLIILAIVQLYKCQPLIPAASSLGNQLPSDEPIVYINLVNTVYQRYMINHAESYLPSGARFAVDRVTRNQIIGLTGWGFSQGHTLSYPLWEETIDRYYDYFLLHQPGISGSFQEKAENRTRNVISSIIYNSDHNIVYSNGESYILHKR